MGKGGGWVGSNSIFLVFRRRKEGIINSIFIAFGGGGSRNLSTGYTGENNNFGIVPFVTQLKRLMSVIKKALKQTEFFPYRLITYMMGGG